VSRLPGTADRGVGVVDTPLVDRASRDATSNRLGERDAVAFRCRAGAGDECDLIVVMG
jgi:hypothetical protein